MKGKRYFVVTAFKLVCILTFLMGHHVNSEAKELRAAVYELENEEANVICKLDILKDSRGNAYAFKITMTKGRKESDVVVKVADELSNFFLIKIRDNQGNEISRKRKNIVLKPIPGRQHSKFRYIRVSDNSKHEWIVPLRDVLDENFTLEDEQVMNVFLYVSVYVLYSPIEMNQLDTKIEYKSTLVNLYDSNVKISNRSLQHDINSEK